MNTRDTIIKLTILERLLEEKISFNNAFRCVFSDYPSSAFCYVLINTGLVTNEKLYNKMATIVRRG